MNRVMKRIICGIVTIALVLSLIPNLGEVKEVEAVSASKVTSLAVSQIGYHEKASPAQLDDFTANSGSGNYTKYARDVNNGNAYGEWCAYFVWWIYQTAGVSADQYLQNGRADRMQEWYAARGRYGARGAYVPRSGDAIFFDKNYNNSADHVGIVEFTTGDKVHFIEGNYSDKVGWQEWSMSDNRIMGYGKMNLSDKTHPGTVLDFGQSFDVTINDVNGDSLKRMDDGTIKMAKYSYAERSSFMWKFDKQSDGTYSISSWKDGMVIDIRDAGTANSTMAWMYSWNASAAQRYYICDIGGGYYVLEPACAPGSVLDRGGLEGEILHLWNYEAGNNNQKFVFGLGDSLNVADEFDASIELSKNGKCLYQNIDSDVILKDYDDNDFNRSMWHFKRYSDGSYKISSWNDKKCLDVSGGANATQTNVLTYLDNGSKAQKWDIFDLGNGTVVLEPRCAPARALDVGATHGSAYIWPYEDGNSNQTFILKKYTGDGVVSAGGILNGHEYIVYKDSLTATQARAKEGNGYHLATITSADENNFIINLTKKISKQPEGYWLGANDNIKEGVFKWETGEPFAYTDPWPAGQPDNNGGELGDENYFGIWASGIWNDFPEAYKLGYVLEKDPPASTASGMLEDHEYKISATYMTRTQAEQYQTDGWYLAAITSSEERDYVVGLINGLSEKNLNGYWLGGNDVETEGTFIWENGEEFSYAPWDGGYPTNLNTLGQEEDYLSILNNGNFNDVSGTYCLGYVLERDPESRIIKVDSINLTSNRNETNDAYEGDTFQLTAEVLPEEATDKTVSWSSSDADYAVVDDTGNVTVNSTLPNTIKTITITATSSDGEVIAEYSFVVCPKSSCQHTWDTGNILSDSTCSKNGEMEYTCTKCGTTKIESIGLKQHTEVIDEAIPATCETEGKTEGSHCSVCGKVLTEQNVIPRLQAPEEDQNNSQDETQKAEQKTGQGDNQKTEQKISQDDNQKTGQKAGQDDNQKIEHKNSQDNSQKNDDKTGQNTERKTTLDEVQMSTPTADEQISVPTEELRNDNTVSYSNEWVNGVWYDENGNQTYFGTLSWKSNSVGWWVEDSTGWYPVSSWQKIDGEWYYFTSSGYMASGEYYNGYWFNSDGTMSNDYYLNWKSNSTGWWVEDKSGWWPSGSWLKINGGWYYFDSDGYMVTNKKIDGYWIGADGVCQ